MRLQAPHAKRTIHFLEHWRPVPGWRLKVYGIRHGGGKPDASLVAHAKEAARPTLPDVRPAAGPYGVGFLGVHEGRGEDFVFLDWWSGDNELHHHVWIRSPPATKLARATAAQPSVCVWDLAVQWREREAWVKHALTNPKGPDLDAYAADVATWDA